MNMHLATPLGVSAIANGVGSGKLLVHRYSTLGYMPAGHPLVPMGINFEWKHQKINSPIGQQTAGSLVGSKYVLKSHSDQLQPCVKTKMQPMRAAPKKKKVNLAQLLLQHDFIQRGAASVHSCWINL